MNDVVQMSDSVRRHVACTDEVASGTPRLVCRAIHCTSNLSMRTAQAHGTLHAKPAPQQQRRVTGTLKLNALRRIGRSAADQCSSGEGRAHAEVLPLVAAVAVAEAPELHAEAEVPAVRVPRAHEAGRLLALAGGQHDEALRPRVLPVLHAAPRVLLTASGAAGAIRAAA